MKEEFKSKTQHQGNSLAVQWLGLGTFTARAWVQSLVRELRSHKPRGMGAGETTTTMTKKHNIERFYLLLFSIKLKKYIFLTHS